VKDLKTFLPPAAMIALVAAALVVACAEGDPEAPGTVTDLNYFQRADALIWNGHVSVGDTAGLADTRLLAFRAPGDDGFSGKASQYDVRYFLASDLGQHGVPADGAAALRSDWDGARRLVGEPDPGRGGHLAQLFLPRINPGETVWFAMTARDEVGQESGVSNVAGPVHVATVMVPVRPAPGDTSEAGFGRVLAGIGDANHDGHSDMILGSPLLGTVFPPLH
jgi:hypothetical protein